MKSGIYKILNKINNKCYIGSSSNLYKRKKQHFNSLLKNKHYNLYLQRAYNKYKLENFEFIILCNCIEEQLINLEQYYIDKFKPEYNSAPLAGKTTGYKFTEEQKRKQSEKRGISIVRIDMISHQILDEWKSAKLATTILNLGNPTAITACCKDKIPSAYGYYWKYKSQSNNYNINTKRTCQPKNKELIKQAMNYLNSGKSYKEVIELTGLNYINIHYHFKIKKSQFKPKSNKTL